MSDAGSFDLLALMKAVAEIEAPIEIGQPYNLKVRKAYPCSPAPAVLPSGPTHLPVFLNSFEPTQSDAGLSGLRINRGVLRVQCLVAEAEPGDEKTQAAVVAFWQATYDAFCQAITLKGRASVAMTLSGSEVPSTFERGGKGYLGFELRLQLTNLDEFAWS